MKTKLSPEEKRLRRNAKDRERYQNNPSSREAVLQRNKRFRLKAENDDCPPFRRCHRCFRLANAPCQAERCPLTNVEIHNLAENMKLSITYTKGHEILVVIPNTTPLGAITSLKETRYPININTIIMPKTQTDHWIVAVTTDYVIVSSIWISSATANSLIRDFSDPPPPSNYSQKYSSASHSA